MQHWLEKIAIPSGGPKVFVRSQSPTALFNLLCTGADRWHAALRCAQAPTDVAQALRQRNARWTFAAIEPSTL